MLFFLLATIFFLLANIKFFLQANIIFFLLANIIFLLFNIIYILLDNILFCLLHSFYTVFYYGIIYFRLLRNIIFSSSEFYIVCVIFRDKSWSMFWVLVIVYLDKTVDFWMKETATKVLLSQSWLSSSSS